MSIVKQQKWADTSETGKGKGLGEEISTVFSLMAFLCVTQLTVLSHILFDFLPFDVETAHSFRVVLVTLCHIL